MNYWKQRRAFRNLKMYEVKLSAGQNNLYRELLDYANDCGLLDRSFRLMNDAVIKLTGLSEDGLIKARNRLTQLEVIDYTPGKRNTDTPVYKIVQLYDENEVEQGNQLMTSRDDSRVSSREDSRVGSRDDSRAVLSTSTGLRQDIKKTSRPKPAARTYGPDSDEYKIADLLWQHILARNPEAKAPRLESWADDIRKMHELDHRPFDKIAKMVEWSQADDFWGTNILSAEKLRKHYDRMAAKANEESAQAKKPKQRYGRPARAENVPDWARAGYEPPAEVSMSTEQQASIAANLALLKRMEDEKNAVT